MNASSRRRWLVAAGAVVVAPLARGQQAGGKPRIAIVDTARPDVVAPLWQAFRAQLGEQGYAEGRNLVVDARVGEAFAANPAAAVTAALSGNPDVLVASGTSVALAAKRATATVPIVFVGSGDPVAAGLVTNLGRPEGNVTGLSVVSPQLSAKWVEALLAFVPAARRIAFLGVPDNAAIRYTAQVMHDAARGRGVEVKLLDATSPDAVDRAFRAMVEGRYDGFVVAIAAQLLAQRDQIVRLAARNRLPAVYARASYVDAGGLYSLGVDSEQQYRKAAEYVARVLRGAKPSDLPVEQPTRFVAALNPRTARALGLAVPPWLQVDRVVE